MKISLPLLVFASFAVAVQAADAPYAGQHIRAIKALSDDETKALLAGAGQGYARAASLEARRWRPSRGHARPRRRMPTSN